MGNKAYDSYSSFRGSLVVDGAPGGNSPVFTDYNVRSTAFSRAGINNPNWRVDVRNMRNASTPMQVDFFKLTAEGFECIKNYTLISPPSLVPRRTWDEVVGGYNNFDFEPFWVHFGPFDELAQSKATSKLYRKLQNAHHQFQGGVFVGEFRKVAAMIAGTASRLKHGVISYLRKATSLKKTPGGPGRPLNNLYLESVFGWQPLVSDCINGAKAIGRLLHENVPVRFRAQGIANIETCLDLGVHTSSPGGTFGVERRTQSTSKVTYYGSFKGTINESAIDHSAQRVISMGGFDLRSFIPTVWELIPYSFLIDYFVNVGELLEAMCTDTDSVAWLSIVRRQDSITETTFRYMSPTAVERETCAPHPQDAVYLGKSGGYKKSLISISRNPTPVPFLMPRFKLSEISGLQFLNIGALITR